MKYQQLIVCRPSYSLKEMEYDFKTYLYRRCNGDVQSHLIFSIFQFKTHFYWSKCGLSSEWVKNLFGVSVDFIGKQKSGKENALNACLHS